MTSSKARRAALSLGAVAGLRTMMAPALTGRYLQKRGASRADFPSGLLTGRPGLLWVLALGELVGDKLPSTPARIAPGPLVARAVSGALVGAALHRAHGAHPATGAALGGTAAVASAYAGYGLRRLLVRVSGLPDPAVAVLEDLTALQLGRKALR